MHTKRKQAIKSLLYIDQLIVRRSGRRSRYYDGGQNTESCFCRGCLACLKLGKCIIGNDAVEIAEKIKSVDVLVFATSVYYYSVSGQLKTMLDRANPLYGSDYRFTDVYLLATAVEDEETTVEGAKKTVQGWIDCFERARFSGVVFAGDVNDAGDIAGHKGLTEAYEAGKNV